MRSSRWGICACGGLQVRDGQRHGVAEVTIGLGGGGLDANLSRARKPRASRQLVYRPGQIAATMSVVGDRAS